MGRGTSFPIPHQPNKLSGGPPQGPETPAQSFSVSLLSSARLGMLYSKTSPLNNVCWKNWGVIKSIYCSLCVELCLIDPQVSNLTKVSVKRQAGRVRELWNRGILNLSALHQVRAKAFREIKRDM